jgi:hypothetical protein
MTAAVGSNDVNFCPRAVQPTNARHRKGAGQGAEPSALVTVLTRDGLVRENAIALGYSE